MKKPLTIITVEIGMLGGIVAAALVAPRSTPLATFLMISGTAVVLGNVLLFRQLKKEPSAESSEGGQKLGISLIVTIAILLLLYWVNRL